MDLLSCVVLFLTFSCLLSIKIISQVEQLFIKNTNIWSLHFLPNVWNHVEGSLETYNMHVFLSIDNGDCNRHLVWVEVLWPLVLKWHCIMYTLCVMVLTFHPFRDSPCTSASSSNTHQNSTESGHSSPWGVRECHTMDCWSALQTRTGSTQNTLRWEQGCTWKMH